MWGFWLEHYYHNGSIISVADCWRAHCWLDEHVVSVQADIAIVDMVAADMVAG